MKKKGYHWENKIVGHTPEGKPIWKRVLVPNNPLIEVPENFPPGEMETHQPRLLDDKDTKKGSDKERG